MKVFLVRHGETIFNSKFNHRTREFEGRKLDSEWNPGNYREWFYLTSKGIEDSEKVARILSEKIGDTSFSIIVSKYKKTNDTAISLLRYYKNKNIEINVDDRVNENSIILDDSNNPINSLPPEIFFKKIKELFDELYNFNPNQLIVIFTHMSTIKTIFSFFLGQEIKFVPNGIIFDLNYDGENLDLVEKYNDK